MGLLKACQSGGELRTAAGLDSMQLSDDGKRVHVSFKSRTLTNKTYDFVVGAGESMCLCLCLSVCLCACVCESMARLSDDGKRVHVSFKSRTLTNKTCNFVVGAGESMCLCVNKTVPAL
jgi:hypothetical protein